jgi:uncharacterized membrane protein YidH (DUF202 family)
VSERWEEKPFDSGLQPERTLLAWRRTALALALASGIAIRLTVGTFGSLAVAVGTCGLVCAVVAYISATLRYRRVHLHLLRHGDLPLGAASILLTSIAALIVGLSGLMYVAGAAFQR